MLAVEILHSAGRQLTTRMRRAGLPPAGSTAARVTRRLSGLAWSLSSAQSCASDLTTLQANNISKARGEGKLAFYNNGQLHTEPRRTRPPTGRFLDNKGAGNEAANEDMAGAPTTLVLPPEVPATTSNADVQLSQMHKMGVTDVSNPPPLLAPTHPQPATSTVRSMDSIRSKEG